MLLNEPFLKAKYCGTVFDNINSDSNIVFVRFYAETPAVEHSKFEASFTAMRNLDTDLKETCDPDVRTQ